MSSQISRRDFLKLLAPLTLLDVKWPRFTGETYGRPQNQEAPNVLILLFDTLSAKHMSVHGYNRETTPNVARFAERATVYHAHYAGGNFTTPGTSSLLTGTYPWSHRGLHIRGTVAESYRDKNLFGAFSAKGYHTIAYSHNPLVNLLLHQFRDDLDVLKKARELGLFWHYPSSDRVFLSDHNVAYWSERAIFSAKTSPPTSLFLSILHGIRSVAQKKNIREQYESLFPRGLPANADETFVFILEHAIDWIEAQLSSAPRPFLGYFHLFPPHRPYNTRREFVDLFDDGWTPIAKDTHFFSKGVSDESLNQMRREYDEYIAYVDAEFGRLYDFMAATGVLENTYVVFTSDHGEMFERGIRGHITPTLYEPIIRIPLLISRPGQKQREDVYTPTSCVDLLPTLLHATGQTIPDWCEGRVVPTSGGQEAGGNRSIFSVEAKENPKQAPITKGTVALVKGRYKLIHYLGYEGYESEYELYGLANDPEEMDDLYLSRKLVAADLQNELDEKLRQVNHPYLV